jgi:hypothetical protein
MSDGATSRSRLGNTYNNGGNVWAYCQAGADIAAYSACIGGTPASVVAANSNTFDPSFFQFMCVPQFDVASGDYFWGVVQSLLGVDWQGNKIKVLAASLTAGTAVTSSTTDGVLTSGGAASVFGLVTVESATVQAAVKFTTWRWMAWAN